MEFTLLAHLVNVLSINAWDCVKVLHHEKAVAWFLFHYGDLRTLTPLQTIWR